MTTTVRLRWDQRWPWLADLGLCAIVVGPLVMTALGLPASLSWPVHARDFLIAGSACALLFWRRRAPLPALAAATALVVLCQAVGNLGEAVIAALEIVLFSAAVRTSRPVAWMAAEVSMLAVVGSGLFLCGCAGGAGSQSRAHA